MSESATLVPLELLQKYDRPGPRYTSYPTVPVWTEKVRNDDYREALKKCSIRKDDPFAIYCHIPFCKRRCYFCGCNTFITNKQDNANAYLSIMGKEIETTARYLGERRKVNQLHLGGGTPTYLSVDGLRSLLDHLDRHFEYETDCEKSIELDPRITTFEQLELLASRGFNRASIGVQDFDHDVQKASGRIQSLEQVQSVLSNCRKLGFKGINLDLIYGLPRQTLESFGKTLNTALEMRPDRFAVYSFAYLPSMKSNQLKIVADDLPTAASKYQLFAEAIERTTKAGYLQVGMDHFALPEDELSLAQSAGELHRNFMGYTVQSSPEMIGFGMSSIGYVENAFYQTLSAIGSYQKAVKENGHAVFRGVHLSQEDLIRQFMITSLMCNFRVDFKTINSKFGIDYHSYFKQEHNNLSGFFSDGFLEEDNNRLRITQLGRTFVRNIVMTFDAYLTQSNKTVKGTFSRTI